jgi:sigma-E factor negative regulatory protein RseA
MSDDSPHPPHAKSDDERWAALSALVDGEAGAQVQERCLALWAEHAGVRSRWRQYQLIGDILRSRDLASGYAHDEAFLSALRARMAREPAVLRPKTAVLLRRLRSWAAPMAATAGVAAVAGVVVMLRTAPDGGGAAQVAVQVAAQPAAAQPIVVSAPVVAQGLQPVNGRLIRDARLDRYFAAHRQSATGTALQMPGSMVRSVDTIVLEDR